MRPLFLRLKGFRGILAGLGVEEIALDLEKLPPGLIAVTGPNGAGKTTVLDNLHPYRLMPFKLRRAKDWSPAAFNFYDQCYGRDAVKNLQWEHGGTTYLSLLLIDAEKRKQEAYLYARGSNGTEWEPLNDGKTKTYDEAVEAILGSPSLYFTAVFRSQGARSLAEYSRGDIMGVISELLRIDTIRDQGEKAREVIKVLNDRRQQDRVRLSDLEQQASLAEQVRAKVAAYRQKIRDAEEKSFLSRANIEETEETVRQLSVDEMREAGKKVERDRLVAEKKDAETEVIKTNTAMTSAGREHDAVRARHVAKREALIKRKERAEKMLAHAQEIREAATREATTRDRLGSKGERLGKLREEADGLRQQEEQRRLLDRKEATLQAEIRQLETNAKTECDRLHHRIETAEQQAGKLDDAACTKRGETFSGCPFIRDAVQARDALDGLRKALREAEQAPASQYALEATLRDTREALAGLHGLSERVGLNQRDINSLSATIEAIEKELTELARWTRLVPELEAAEHTVADIAEEMAAVLTEEADDRERLRERLEETRAAHEAAKDLVVTLKHRIEEAELGLDPKVSQRLQEAKERLSGLRATLTATEGGLRALGASVGAEERTLANLLAAETAAGEIRSRIGRFDAEIARFRLVEKACSNSGVIALEIDDAGPGISALANDLLATCYGSRFSVRIETQSEKRDGTAKEDFDITVFDAETGSTTSIREKSGGQATWIEDALTRAICLYQIGGSGQTYHALFSDEKDGALDAERKQEFLAVKRRALEVGTHDKEFFISQTPELVEMADARIVVGNGQIRVEA